MELSEGSTGGQRSGGASLLGDEGEEGRGGRSGIIYEMRVYGTVSVA
jgi:hypothetical protein